MPSVTLIVSHRGRTIEVPIDLAAASGDGDDARQFDALRHAVVVACAIDPALEPKVRLLGPGGRVVVASRGGVASAEEAAQPLAATSRAADGTRSSPRSSSASPSAARRLQMLPREIVDGSKWMALCPSDATDPSTAAAAPCAADDDCDAEDEAPLMYGNHTASGPLPAEDLSHLLRCCSATTLPGAALLQPRFAYTLYLETEGPDAPMIPVCGPCAHSCLKMQHVHIMDGPAALERPFGCACRTIIADGHECFWADDVHAPLDRPEQRQLRNAWRREHREFTDSITGQLEAAAKEDQRAALEKLTGRLRGAVDMFEQYRDEDAQAAARTVIPMAMLEQRARADMQSTAEIDAASGAAAASPAGTTESSRLHHALLRQLVAWFHDDFFQWMSRPPCSQCEGGRTDPIPKSVKEAVMTAEERQNWAAGVELYSCRDCGAEARFPRYQRAKRLLTYRKGRCGEFATCFALCAAAVGFDVRMLTSSADRAWNEVYSSYAGRWVHVDASKGLVDSPLNDESTSGKSHPYVFAISTTDVVDVSLRYTTNALKYLTRDSYSETALSRLIRGLSRTGALRVPKASLALHEERQRVELRELAAPFTAEEGAGALVEAFTLADAVMSGAAAEVTFDSASGSDGRPFMTPAVNTLVSMKRRHGVVSVVTAVNEDATSAEDEDEDEESPAPVTKTTTQRQEWCRLNGSPLIIGGPETHFELRPPARRTTGCCLPVPPKREDVLAPYVFFAFDVIAEPRGDGSAAVDVAIGTAIHVSAHWGGGVGAGSRFADVLVKYPDLTPLSEHSKLGGHAPIVPGLGELRLQVPLGEPATARHRMVHIGLTIDALGILRIAAVSGIGEADAEDALTGPLRSDTRVAHALVAPHALSEVAGGSAAPLAVYGHAVKVSSLNAVSSGP